MNNGRKVSSKKNISQWFIALLAITLTSFNSYAGEFFQDTTRRAVLDTNRLNVSDTGGKPLRTDTIPVKKVSKDSIAAPIIYSALDSMVLDVPSKKIILYNEASTQYTDLDIKAYKIELDQPKNLVIATFGLDSAGKMIGQPKFVQAETNMQMDSIIYNIETQKGITRSTYTNQGEVFVYGEKIKKISPTEFFALRGRFTTCNLDTPHFSFQTNKLKLVNKKFAITGPVHPEFEGVPVPVYLPFGFFPLAQGRHSGMLPPQFTTNEQFGLGLEGLGYYKVFGDMFDATLRGDIYSYGGYRLNLTPTYRKRYRYAGTLGLSYQSTRLLADIGTKEYSSSKTFHINWAHSRDNKARPGTTFSASVNAGSTKYNQYIANNPTLNFQNQLASSIVYTKNWDNKYNVSLSANHSQNNNTRLVDLNMPNIAFNVANFYPFQPKEMVGTPKWYQKLGLGLTSTVTSRASFYDSLFNFKKIIDTFQVGAQHSIPISLSLPPAGPFQMSPGISYSEKWYDRQTILRWDSLNNKLDTMVNRGFYTARDVSFSFSLSTAIFGLYNFKKSKNIKAIRHVIRPQVSLNYKPDMAGKDYYLARLDSAGERVDRISKYAGSFIGAFSPGTFGGISFSLDNNLEMKARSKTDTAAESDRKVKLIDGFGLSGSYNLMADSQKLSPISIYIRSTLFEKVNITAGTTLNPYVLDKFGRSTNAYAWQGKPFSLGSLGKLTNGNIAVSTSFQSKPKDESKTKENPIHHDDGIPTTLEEQQAELDYIRSNPSEFTDFNIPWSLNLSYSLSFSNVPKPDYSGFETQITSSVNLNGDFNLTPKWKMGMSTYYDFRGSSIQTLTMTLSREMHCWQMSVNVTPVGLYRSFNITISPKSGMLRDLKINRSRSFSGLN